MFSYEERIRAVNLLIHYDLSYADVIRELGYPARGSLRNWYNEYKECNDLHARHNRKYKYTIEKKQVAVSYYLEHGKSVARTIRKLGYPSRPELDKWISELVPDQKRHCRSGGAVVQYSREQKEQAVISLCSRSKSAKDVATEIGVTREVLYNWKRQLLSEGCEYPMSKKTKSLNDSRNTEFEVQSSALQKEKVSLKKQVDELQKEVYRLQIERDILEAAAEVIKKDQGISLKILSNREKAIVINALRKKYQLKDLLEILHMAKSSYCYQTLALSKADKYKDLREEVKSAFSESYRCYGYRRIHSVLKTAGTIVSEKVILRIMKEEQLIVPNIKRKNILLPYVLG